MNFKKIYILIVLVLISVSVVSASEVSDQNMQPDMDNACLNDNQPSDNSQLIAGDITESDESVKDDKNIKMASKTYDVNDYNSLNQALTSDAYDKVTLNIKSNIKLSNNTTLNTAIKELSINGNSRTVDGDNSNRFLIIAENSTVTIKNLNINNCHYAMSYFGGGAIYNKGTLTLTGCSFKNNYAQYGGVIHSYVNNLTVQNCEFTDNTAGDDGSVIYSLGSLKITNSTFKNNKAVESGGAIQIERGNVTILKSTFINNTAQFGGAIDSYGNLTIKDTIMNDNHAVGSWSNGGSIFNCNNLTLINTTITNSSAFENGGAIYNSYSRLNMTKSTLSNNKARIGAGVCNNYANCSINNSNLNYNSAYILGGAVYNYYSNMTINNTQLNYNNATKSSDAKPDFNTFCGGAIRNYFGNLSISNSNLSKNNAGYDGAAVYNYDYSNLIITNTTLNDNYASNAGAAIRNCANLTIYNSTLNYNKADYSGAAIYDNANLTIVNTMLNNNTAKVYGAAIYTNNSLNITKSTLNSNRAVDGAAIYNNENGSATMDNCILNSNYVTNTGSAIRNCGNMTIVNSKLNNNNANYSGAIYDTGNMTIKNSQLINNTASNAGAISNAKGNMIVINTTFDNNSATGKYSYGDGAAISNNANLTVTKCSLTNNTADNWAGAIYNSANLTVTDTNFTSNKAKYYGAAIVTNGKLMLKGSIFKNNTASIASAVYIVRKNATVENNTFITNRANITGTAIINTTKSTISNNINADTSKYNASIYSSGENVIIKNNIFDDGIIYTKTQVSSASGIIGEKLTLMAIVNTLDNKKVNEGNLIFKLNGITIKDNAKLTGSSNPLKVKVVNGVASVTITPDLNMRNANKLTASYIGTFLYNASLSNQVKINISRRNASLEVSSNVKSIKQGQVLTLTAKVYDVTNNKKNTNLIKFEDEFVYFKVNGITLKDSNGAMLKVKVVNGVARVNYTIPLGLSGVTDGKTMTPKNHTILAGFYNKNYQDDVRNSSFFNVERSDITINISNVTVNNKTHKLSLKAVIKDYLGNVIAGPNKCVIKINGLSLKNGTNPLYYYSTDGILNIKNIVIPSYKNYKNIEIVTQDRLAYKSQRNTTTMIKILNK